jgi:hypothetical protein
MLPRISAYSITRSARIRSVDFFAFQDEGFVQPSYGLNFSSIPSGKGWPLVREILLGCGGPKKANANHGIRPRTPAVFAHS